MPDPTHLERLIIEPAETPEVEYKEWLDLQNKPHKAKLAKELIALRNHGGGHLVLGIEAKTFTSLPRPTNYEYVDTDFVNGIVERYADPAFHCSVAAVQGHLIITVPAGVTVPTRSTRGSQGAEIQLNSYYTRRPGPKSEPPRNGLEWDELLRRCFANRETELEATVRRVLRATRSVTQELPAEPTDAIESLLE